MCKNMKQKKKKTNEVRSGEVMHLVMQINENNQNLILENPSLSLERLQKEIPAFDSVIEGTVYTSPNYFIGFCHSLPNYLFG